MNINISNKKIAIPLVAIILIIVLAVSLILILNHKSQPTQLTSNDNSFRITIPSKIKFERKSTDTLDIFSKKDEMILSSTVMKKDRDVNLSDVAALEMAGLSNNKSNLDNLSELNKIDLKNYEAYKYSYTYFDQEYNNNFYVEIVWIKTDKNIYVLDLEVITKNQEKYKDLFNEIINSFEEI